MLKRFMLGLMLAAGLLLLAPAPQADASDWGWHSSEIRHRHSRWRWWSWWSWWSGGGDKDGGGNSKPVPELDPGAAGSAMVLLIGGVAYIASRRRNDDDA